MTLISRLSLRVTWLFERLVVSDRRLVEARVDGARVVEYARFLSCGESGSLLVFHIFVNLNPEMADDQRQIKVHAQHM